MAKRPHLLTACRGFVLGSDRLNFYEPGWIDELRDEDGR
jgi:hypothetical protein